MLVQRNHQPVDEDMSQLYEAADVVLDTYPIGSYITRLWDCYIYIYTLNILLCTNISILSLSSLSSLSSSCSLTFIYINIYFIKSSSLSCWFSDSYSSE